MIDYRRVLNTNELNVCPGQGRTEEAGKEKAGFPRLFITRKYRKVFAKSIEESGFNKEGGLKRIGQV